MNLTGELGNSVEFSVALDLNANKDEVLGSKGGSRATCIDTVAVSLVAVFDDQSNNLTGEICVAASVFDAVKNGGAWIRERSWWSWANSAKSKVKGKLEFATRGGDAENVGAIDGTAVPSVGGNHGGFDPD
jgi:hypothetical protein